jgi:hypothetical protein
MQPTGADAVLADLVFLNLLECHYNRLAEFFLAYLAALAQKSNARTNRLVNWIFCPLAHVSPQIKKPEYYG